MNFVSRANQPFIDRLRLRVIFTQWHSLVEDARVELQAGKLHLFLVFLLRFLLCFTLSVLNLGDWNQGLHVVVRGFLFFILLCTISKLRLHKRVICHIEKFWCILVNQVVTKHRCSIPWLLGLLDQVNPDRLHYTPWILMLSCCLLLWIWAMAQHSVTDQTFAFFLLILFFILGMRHDALSDIRIRVKISLRILYHLSRPAIKDLAILSRALVLRCPVLRVVEVFRDAVVRPNGRVKDDIVLAALWSRWARVTPALVEVSFVDSTGLAAWCDSVATGNAVSDILAPRIFNYRLLRRHILEKVVADGLVTLTCLHAREKLVRCARVGRRRDLREVDAADRLRRFLRS